MEISARILPQWFEYEGASFLLAPLTSAQLVNVQQLIANTRTRGDGLLAAACGAVIDWKGITENGVDVPFSPEARDEQFSHESWALPMSAVAAEVMKRARLRRDEKKK